KFPAATSFRPPIEDGRFVLYHGTSYRKARSIQLEGKLVTKDGEIHLTDDKKYAVEWARIRMKEKRELGRPAVVTVKVSQELLPMFRRREPTSRNILYDGLELPVKVVKIDLVGWL
ncbi:MAG: hypothetical protein NWE89_00765, partial [Candidatus Bathyarchaeota archaeon]|nr:hypothetical protein [Candidatus Bathyarchaeota archaeon]